MSENDIIEFKMGKKEFTSFIVDLLGKQQTISKIISGSFEIGLSDLCNIFNTINQRIEQQNKANLIQFRTKIIYDDESSVLLGSYDELNSYSEIKKLIPVSVHLEIEYLIQFQDKDKPERQEIEISFISNNFSQGRFIVYDDVPFKLINRDGIISLRIKHTARTWAADIESLISHVLSNLLKSESPIKKFIRKHRVKISSIVPLIFLLSIFICIYFTTNNYALIMKNNLSSNLNNIKGENIHIINKKLSYLGDFLASGQWSQYLFYSIIFIIISFITVIFLSFWISSSAHTKEPSLILITKEAEKYKEKLNNTLKKKWISFTFSLIISIGINVFANFLFYTFFCSKK